MTHRAHGDVSYRHGRSDKQDIVFSLALWPRGGYGTFKVPLDIPVRAIPGRL
jgi:hypothetical protein